MIPPMRRCLVMAPAILALMLTLAAPSVSQTETSGDAGLPAGFAAVPFERGGSETEWLVAGHSQRFDHRVRIIHAVRGDINADGQAETLVFVVRIEEFREAAELYLLQVARLKKLQNLVANIQIGDLELLDVNGDRRVDVSVQTGGLSWAPTVVFSALGKGLKFSRIYFGQPGEWIDVDGVKELVYAVETRVAARVDWPRRLIRQADAIDALMIYVTCKWNGRRYRASSIGPAEVEERTMGADYYVEHWLMRVTNAAFLAGRRMAGSAAFDAAAADALSRWERLQGRAATPDEQRAVDRVVLESATRW